MGADENAAIMRRGYEAFNSWATWTRSPRSSTRAPCGTCRGEVGRPATTRAARRFWPTSVAWGRETGGTFQAELQQLLADDDGRVVGIQRSTAQRNGKKLDVGDCIVFQLKDGRITDGREHFHDLYAWDEFWS